MVIESLYQILFPGFSLFFIPIHKEELQDRRAGATSEEGGRRTP